MQKSNSVLKKYILSISFGLLSSFSSIVFSSNYTTNFLPMEDALSANRNSTNNAYINPKPHRDFYSLDNNRADPSPLASVDFLAFILLGGVYFIIINKKSKPRNISL